MKFNTRFNPPRPEGIIFDECSKTEQCFKDECDTDRILQRYAETGTWSSMPSSGRVPMFEDVSDVPELASHLSQMNNLQSMFSGLPAEVKARFGNLSALVEWLSDPTNVGEARELGLLSPDESASVASNASNSPADAGAPATTASEASGGSVVPPQSNN